MQFTDLFVYLFMTKKPNSRSRIPDWLKWAREIQALAQTGLTFAHSEYEILRNKRLLELAAEITSQYGNLSPDDLLDNFSAQPGYATPKIDVRGAVIREGKLLLVQECTDKRWAMPGGWADVGESPAEMVVREVREESGFIVKPLKVIGVYDANRSGRPMQFYHAYKIIFLCELVGGRARSSNETLDVGFFPFDQLPPLSQNRTNEMHLGELRAHLSDPDRKTAFD